MNEPCAICLWIKELPSSDFLIKELQTGYAVLSKYQFNKGYTLFLFKEHITELHTVPTVTRNLFLQEMSKVGEAIYNAVHPDKLNYELLGNAEPHLHCHIIPRYKTEKEFHRPIWVIDKSIRQSKKTYPTMIEVKKLKEKILKLL